MLDCARRVLKQKLLQMEDNEQDDDDDEKWLWMNVFLVLCIVTRRNDLVDENLTADVDDGRRRDLIIPLAVYVCPCR